MECEEPGPSGIKFMTRRYLYSIIRSSTELNFTSKLDFMEERILEKYSEDESQHKEIKQKLSAIKHQFKKRWLAAHKKRDVFEKKNSNWLDSCISIPLSIAKTSPGRPENFVVDLTERSKRCRTEDLQSEEAEKLVYAAHMKLRASGKLDQAKVVKDLTKSSTRAKKYRSAMHNYTEQPVCKLSPLDALSMFVEADLTRSQYEILRSSSKNLYPSYSILQKAKQDCYPPTGSYTVTATCAEVEIQSLLDHTACRLLLYLEEVVSTLNENEKQSLELIYKWGCDGSQQTQYKMKFENEYSDANIFQSSMVPLRLNCNKKIVWQNPTPSTPRYCRPMRIRYVQETVDETQQEIKYIKSKISNLKSLEFADMKLKHTLLFTMVDGKVCNASTQTTSTMRCYICGASAKEFNDLKKTKEPKEETLNFGISILHTRVRFLEHILHVAYKLPIKKWQIRSQSDRDLVQGKKKEIQARFKKEMGLIVDAPKANFGSTNDGNTSRRFFSDHELSAAITGIDVDLIYRFKVLLEVISSGQQIHVYKFQQYTKETEELYIQLYSWHPMSPTLHKVLRHGPEVISNALLPIGQLSEEVAKARNKHFKSYRLNYTRKFSRESCNMDILNRLLLTSDPLLTGMRKISKRKTSTFSREALNLLHPAEPNPSSDDETTEAEE